MEKICLSQKDATLEAFGIFGNIKIYIDENRCIDLSISQKLKIIFSINDNSQPFNFEGEGFENKFDSFEPIKDHDDISTQISFNIETEPLEDPLSFTPLFSSISPKHEENMISIDKDISLDEAEIFHDNEMSPESETCDQETQGTVSSGEIDVSKLNLQPRVVIAQLDETLFNNSNCVYIKSPEALTSSPIHDLSFNEDEKESEAPVVKRAKLDVVNNFNHEAIRCEKQMHVDSNVPETVDESPQSIYSCSYCNKTFKSRKEKLLHYQLHNGANIKNCKWCGKEFLSTADLFLHQYRSYPTELIAEEYPSFTITNRKFYNRHQCMLCGKKTNHDKRTHIDRHFSEKSYKCCICDFSSTTRHTLSTHQRVTHAVGSSEKDYSSLNLKHSPKITSNVCDAHQSRDQRSACQKPALAVNKSFETCSLCRVSFTSLSEFDTHHRVKTSMQKCTKCDEEYFSSFELFLHQYIAYDGDFLAKEYPALKLSDKSACGKTQCPFCLEIKSSSSRYLMHITTHFPEYSFTCCICNYRGKSQENLTRHFFENHNQIKPLKRNWNMESKISSQSLASVNSADVKVKELQKNSDTSCSLHEVRATLSKNATFEETSKSVVTEVVESKDVVEQLHPCRFCGENFSTTSAYTNHLKRQSTKVQCPSCLAIVKSQAALILHEYECHSDHQSVTLSDASSMSSAKTMHSCPICPHSVGKRFILLEHITAMHTKELHFQCCVCGEQAGSRTKLRHHAKKKHLKNVSKEGISCMFCSEKFPDRKTCSRHFIEKHKSQCIFCGLDLGHPSLAKRHYEAEHLEQMYSCDHCDNLYPTALQLNYHKSYVRNYSGAPCPLCGVFAKGDLRVHFKKHHPNNLDLLKKDLGGKKQLNHASEDQSTSSHNSLECPECHKMLSNKRSFERHMDRHAGIRHACPICSKSLSSRNQLSRHLKLIHTQGIPMFTCHICGKQTKVKSNLKIHMRVHMLQKVFHCDYCGQGFNYNASLQSHLKSKHQKDVFVNRS